MIHNKNFVCLFFTMQFGFSIMLLLSISLSGTRGGNPCIGRSFGETSFVCVCNSTYCDIIDLFEESDMKDGSFIHYESTLYGKRLYLTKEKFSKDHSTARIGTRQEETSFTVNQNVRYQKIVGFGAALSDAVGIVLSRLQQQTRELILRQYFGNEGLNYKLLRVPIAASDFSVHRYTYDDNGTGFSLSTFNLTMEDYKYKIPLFKQMQAKSKFPLHIIATPWIAPERMMGPRYFNWKYIRKLRKEYYELYAEYFLKFLEAYKKEGIEVWGLTMQNEPLPGLIGMIPYSSMGWTPSEMGIFIGQHVGPLLRSKGFGQVKIFAWDDTWIFCNAFMRQVLHYAKEYVYGIAFHSYFQELNPGATSVAHLLYPKLKLFQTEYSIMPEYGKPSVRLGHWEDLETYVSFICDAMNNWLEAWMDWNIVLDEEGGPTLIGNALESPIIVTKNSEEFYKQPIWYGIAHIAHFVPPGSIRIDLRELGAPGIKSTAFLTPEDNVVVVLLNKDQIYRDVVVIVSDDQHLRATLIPRSVHTFIYKSNQLSNGSTCLVNSMFSSIIFIFIFITRHLCS